MPLFFKSEVSPSPENLNWSEIFITVFSSCIEAGFILNFESRA